MIPFILLSHVIMQKKNAHFYPSSCVEPRQSSCSIYPSSVVEPCKTICSIYPSSIAEGQHMYRQEDGLTPGQLKKKYVPTPTDNGTVTLTEVQSAALPQLCPHRKWYYSLRVPMNGGI